MGVFAGGFAAGVAGPGAPFSAAALSAVALSVVALAGCGAAGSSAGAEIAKAAHASSETGERAKQIWPNRVAHDGEQGGHSRGVANGERGELAGEGVRSGQAASRRDYPSIVSSRRSACLRGR